MFGSIFTVRYVNVNVGYKCFLHFQTNKCASYTLILTALLLIADNAGIVRLFSVWIELMCNALNLERSPQSKVMTLLLCLIDDNCRKQNCYNCEYRTDSNGELKEH